MNANNNTKPTRRLNDERSIVKFIIFSTITFGIYDIWYFYHLINDIHILFYDEDEPLPKYPKYLLYSIFTLGFYNMYYWLKVAEKMRIEARKRKLDIEVSSGLILISHILSYILSGLPGLCAYAIIFKALNIIAEDYNKKLR